MLPTRDSGCKGTKKNEDRRTKGDDFFTRLTFFMFLTPHSSFLTSHFSLLHQRNATLHAFNSLHQRGDCGYGRVG